MKKSPSNSNTKLTFAFQKEKHLKKGSKLYSIFFMKCPHCHEGDLFDEPNPYKLNKIADMPSKCSECGQVYQLEPSFYYGAMYVNYGITVATAVSVFVIMMVLGKGWELNDFVIGIVAAIILLMPLTFRIGRSVYINLFVSYDPKAIENRKN